MTLLAVTTKGQVTLKRDLLQHLGIKAGERIELDKLPGGNYGSGLCAPPAPLITS